MGIERGDAADVPTEISIGDCDCVIESLSNVHTIINAKSARRDSKIVCIEMTARETRTSDQRTLSIIKIRSRERVSTAGPARVGVPINCRIINEVNRQLDECRRVSAHKIILHPVALTVTETSASYHYMVPLMKFS